MSTFVPAYPLVASLAKVEPKKLYSLDMDKGQLTVVPREPRECEIFNPNFYIQKKKQYVLLTAATKHRERRSHSSFQRTFYESRL